MVKKVLKFWSNPGTLLRRILAMDDSPHAVALGVATGVFIGLTPTVGIQTVMVLALVFVCRRLCYFNASAAMISTYVSNPVTMLPMYYFWYRLGAWFLPGAAESVNLDVLTDFDGIVGWWNGICDLGLRVAVPMFVGALITAPIGAIPAYFATYYALERKRRRDPARGSASETASDTAAGTSPNTDQSSDGPVAMKPPESSESAENDSVITSA